jgi:diacylglycerol kinase
MQAARSARETVNPWGSTACMAMSRCTVRAGNWGVSAGRAEMKVMWMSSPWHQDGRGGRESAVPRHGFWRSFSFAGQGVWHAVRTQRNMRVHLLAAAAAVVAGLILRISAVDWACVFMAIGLVLTAEALNTVVEALADLCTREFHPLAKIAKDTAAGAVLISSVAALAVGIAVFLPRLLR